MGVLRTDEVFNYDPSELQSYRYTWYYQGEIKLGSSVTSEQGGEGREPHCNSQRVDLV